MRQRGSTAQRCGSGAAVPESAATRPRGLIADRLRAVLENAGPDPARFPAAARDCLDRAYEAAYAENHASARALAEAGLARSSDADLDVRLGLYSVLIALDQLSGDQQQALDYLQARIALLKRHGLAAEAAAGERLGTVLFREAGDDDLPLLEAELAHLTASHSPASVTSDVQLAIAVVRSQRGEAQRAITLLEEAVAGYERAGRTDSMSGALMYLANTYLQADQPERATAAADRMLALPGNRATTASMWLLKANAAGGEGAAGLEEALTALELYAAAGVRKGAISAAVVLARLCAGMGDYNDSVLAWQAAVAQAERGEVQEELTLRLALGNQLLEAEEYELAGEVLSKLLQRLEQTKAPHPQVARALMSMGHAHRHAGRTAEALDCWRRAVAEFGRGGEFGESARALLATGTLLSREDREKDALVCFEAAVAAARKAEDDDAALPQALHALGHALCEAGNPDGLTALDEAISLAREYGAHWYEADYSDTRARGLWALEDGTGAVSAALHAADLYSAADDAASAGNSELFAAHVLAEMGRPDDAVPMFKLVLQEPDVGRTLRVAAHLGLASALDDLGRTVEADIARRAADAAADGTD